MEPLKMSIDTSAKVFVDSVSVSGGLIGMFTTL